MAQDPFFVNFKGSPWYFNPALVGSVGATSLHLNYKNQWKSAGHVPYETKSASFEEAVPCGWFDYGFHYLRDVEGDGILTTNQFGGSLVGTIPSGIKYRKSDKSGFNVRAGFSLMWAQKRIDFDNLVFSDQLDPKYGEFDRFGNINPTAFPFSGGGESMWYFTPSVGMMMKYAAGTKYKKPWELFLNTASLGLGFHNPLDIFNNQNIGQISSLIDLQTVAPNRLSIHGEVEGVKIFARTNQFLALKIQTLYQTQTNLDYFEIGGSIDFNRIIAIGSNFHFTSFSDQGRNTNWWNFFVEVSPIFPGPKDKYRNRIDFGFAFANNFSGLQNVVGPILEFSISYHLDQSTYCNLTGNSDMVKYKGGPICHRNGRGKIYDQIWY